MAGTDPIDLIMPELSPGSPVNSLNQPTRISGVEATNANGDPLPLQKAAMGHWRLERETEGPVTVHYTVKADEFSHVRSYVSDKLAYMDGPSALMFVQGREHDTPATVQLENLPDPNWKSSSSLYDVKGAPHTFYAPSYDDIADSNILAGNFQKASGTCGDVALTVNQNGTPPWADLKVNGATPEESLSDLKQLYTTFLDRFGSFPLQRFNNAAPLPAGVDQNDKYVVTKNYLHGVGPNAGGYEHYHGHELLLHKTAGPGIAKRFDGDGRAHERHIMAHELMHKLMAKYVRHEGIDSADLSKVGSTDGLWLSEGGVEWAAMALERAAGLSTPAQYTGMLQDQYRKYLSDYAVDPSNGRENSFDAHIGNSSFYNKGAVTTSLLDLQLRAATGGEKGLFDVFHSMKEEFGGNGKFWDLNDVERLCHSAVGDRPQGQAKISSFFDEYLRDHKQFDFNALLEPAGYRLNTLHDGFDSCQIPVGGATLISDSEGQVSLEPGARAVKAGTTNLPAFGLSLAQSATGELKLSSVTPGSSAYEQGLADFAGQPVVSVGARVAGQSYSLTTDAPPAGNVEALVLQFNAVDTFTGQSELKTVEVSPAPISRYELAALPQPSPAQAAVRKAWLG